MSFDWMENPAPKSRPAAWQEQHERGIKQRAKLLYNLRFSEAQATARIERALAWEFDADLAKTPLPPFFKEIGGLVSGVYAHQRRGTEAASPKKAAKKSKKKT